MQNPKKMYGKHGLHLEGYSKKFYTGRSSAPKSNLHPFIYHFWRKRDPFRIPSIDNWYPFQIPSLEPVADPGEGPPLFLDQTEARRAENFLGGTGPPPYIRGWFTGPPPPPQGLDPARRTLHPFNRNNRLPLEAWKRYPFQAELFLIGHYRKYPPGSLPRKSTDEESLIRVNHYRRSSHSSRAEGCSLQSHLTCLNQMSVMRIWCFSSWKSND